MTTTTLTAQETTRPRGPGGAGIVRIAWRNLWRNRRRTWLTSGGVAFAVLLLVFAMSMQSGTFEIMVDNGARLGLGHVQIQHPAYLDDPRMEYTLADGDALLALAEETEDVIMAAGRVQGFALVSFGERSFGAQVVGVDAQREKRWSSMPAMVSGGRYLEGPGEAFVGSVLARNLGLVAGDEIVLLGTARDGGVAAAVAEVVGLFTSGQPELDRSLLQIPIDDFRAAWMLEPQEVHSLVILAGSVAESIGVASRLEAHSDGSWRALNWRQLMPEAVQTIDLKFFGTVLIFSLVAIIVTFSIVNTFMMTVFERTPEFGMLMAIGMRPGRIMAQLALEAMFLAVLGAAIGITLSLMVLLPLAELGMPLPADATEILQAYHIPDRMYPSYATGAAIASVIIMILGTQLAALVPALRIRGMRPVNALRAHA
ncbi:MAG: ABC transporter permease [Pseudomonadales bacterium]